MEKKTSTKSTRPAAKRRAPRLVTKDTNDSGVKNTVVDPLSVIETAPPVIDAGVFDDEKYEDIPETVSAISKSVTIDGSFLSRERTKKSRTMKTGRKKVLASDIADAERFDTKAEKGLSAQQVEKRNADGLVNVPPKQNGKTYRSIFFSNIFTFFNLLTFTVAAALISVGAGFSNLFFLIIITLNIVIGIIQEIRSKVTVDKLSIMNAPSALVVRDGERQAVPVGEVVLDDIVYLGQTDSRRRNRRERRVRGQRSNADGRVRANEKDDGQRGVRRQLRERRRVLCEGG